MQRDFIGYGQNVPQVSWPNDARVAVSVVVNYEEGSEHSLLDGDDYHETNNEVPSPVPPGIRDLNNESFFEYGSRVGVWRLLDLFDQHQVKTTFYCCALALERNREVASAIVARCHGRRSSRLIPPGASWPDSRAAGSAKTRPRVLEKSRRYPNRRPRGSRL